ncbi:hypothetical protein PsorP6_010934 [Peronosclerospora sorghi]|uniref:Uncharacterized protein n=1 Tax=Peronosclerospora sorghi TaxID=230839 RepID=A0ACC0VZ68_9STRA|nr:hypothetical protein PsorP6_010934 [Peronosclerospora sorghi]
MARSNECYVTGLARTPRAYGSSRTTRATKQVFVIGTGDRTHRHGRFIECGRVGSQVLHRHCWSRVPYRLRNDRGRDSRAKTLARNTKRYVHHQNNHCYRQSSSSCSTEARHKAAMATIVREPLQRENTIQLFKLKREKKKRSRRVTMARIFEPAPKGSRKCVVATNIAEASLRIDGI